MKRILIILFLLFTLNLFSQPGFNKTFFVCSPYSSILNNIISLDSCYFISGGSYLCSNPNIPNTYYSFLTSFGDTFNFQTFNDTNSFQYGNLIGTAINFNNNIYQTIFALKLDTTPITKQALLLRFDLTNNEIYQKVITSDTLQRGTRDITELDNYFYITGNIEFPGYSYYDIMLLKTDTLGNLIWMKHFGNDKAIGYQIISTYDHKIMVAADSYENYYNKDQWRIMKFDTAGNIIWSKDFGNPQYNDYPPCYLIETSDSCYIITGHYSQNDYEDGLARLLKIDPNGNIVMDKYYGCLPSYALSAGITKEKPNKDLIVNMRAVAPPDSAYYTADKQILVLLNSEGKIKWYRTYYYNEPPDYQGVYEAEIESMEFTPEGGYICAGYGTDARLTPAERGWIFKVDSLGFDGSTTHTIDTTYRVEHIADSCFNNTAVVYTHIFGVSAPYTITYAGFATHDSLYYSPLFERYVADSLIITSAMLTGSDSIIPVVCHITDGIGRTLTDTIQVNVACLVDGINNESWKNDIQIYPNPANSNLTVAITNEQLQITNVRILNITGQEVKSIKPKGQSKHYNVDIKDLPAGLYFVKVATDKGALIKKIVKQ